MKIENAVTIEIIKDLKMGTFKSKFQKDVIEGFLRWLVVKIETDRVNSVGKKSRDKVDERFLALKILCEKSDLSEILEKIQDGRRL
jgi:hypothetical protein